MSSNQNYNKKRKQPIGWIILSVLKNTALFLMRSLVVVGCLAVIAGSLAAVWVSLYIVEETANDDQLLDLNNYKLSFTTILYAKNPDTGEYEEYQRLIGDENRIWTDYQNISEHMVNAVVAVEDSIFWEHDGINYARTLAATITDITSISLLDEGDGASTITQQLVKNITGDDSIDRMRKVREIFRAIALENRYSKEVIMEAYLNTFRLSDNIAGVETAANVYFGKSAGQLTIPEAAMIAGITQSPVQYDPYDNPENCLERRNTVLYHMNRVGYITQEELEMYWDEPLGLISETEPVPARIVIEGEDGELIDETGEQVDSEELAEVAGDVSVDEDGTLVRTKEVNSWYTDMVIDDVIDDLVEQKGYTKEEASYYLYNSGLRIYLPIDLDLQQAMEDFYYDPAVYNEYYPEIEATAIDGNGEPILDENGETTTVIPQAAMVTVGYNGEILGIIGGLGEKTGDRILNRAADSLRQTGSTMKPIGAYAPALEYDRITYSTGIVDSPITLPSGDSWPKNYSQTYTNEPTTIQYAISRSLNTIAVKSLERITTDISFDFLTESLQISSLVESEIIDGMHVSDKDLGPLALGSMTYGITPLEMAGAYSIFGNGGKYTTLHSYTSVENSAGELIMEPILTTNQAISPETSMIMNKMLETVLQSGGTAGTAMQPDYLPAVGKTGTTSDNRDHWWIGLTPYYVTASWWGYDEPQELNYKSLYTTHPPSLSWRDIMNTVQADKEEIAFPTTDKVTQLRYCTETGLTAVDGCPSATGYFKRDSAPPPCPGNHVADPAVPVV